MRVVGQLWRHHGETSGRRRGRLPLMLMRGAKLRKAITTLLSFGMILRVSTAAVHTPHQQSYSLMQYGARISTSGFRVTNYVYVYCYIQWH